MLIKAAQYSANLLFRVSPSVYRPFYFSYKRWSDAYLLSLLQKDVKPGDTALDIGANIGFFSMELAAMCGKAGKVYAFEPDPDNFRELQKTVGHLPQVSLHNKAVGAENGTLTLYRSSLLNVDHRTYQSSENIQQISVEAVALDSFFDHETRVNVIKMDIQGFEYFALQGMKRILQEQKPLIVSEFWPWGLQQSGSSSTDVFDLLHDTGYDIFLIKAKEARLEPLKRINLGQLKTEEASYYNIFAQAYNH